MKTLLALVLLFAFPVVADAVPVTSPFAVTIHAVMTVHVPATVHEPVTTHEPAWRPPVAEVFPIPAWLEAALNPPLALTSEPLQTPDGPVMGFQGLTSDPLSPLAHTPEPATALLFGAGLALAAAVRQWTRATPGGSVTDLLG